MAFEKEYREENDTFMDALEENYFLEEINQLKICLEEKKNIHRNSKKSASGKGETQ